MSEEFELNRIIDATKFPDLNDWIDCNKFICSLTDIKQTLVDR